MMKGSGLHFSNRLSSSSSAAAATASDLHLTSYYFSTRRDDDALINGRCKDTLFKYLQRILLCSV